MYLSMYNGGGHNDKWQDMLLCHLNIVATYGNVVRRCVNILGATSLCFHVLLLAIIRIFF